MDAPSSPHAALPVTPGRLQAWRLTGSRLEATYAACIVSVAALTPTMIRVRLAPGRFAARRSWAIPPPDTAFAPIPVDASDCESGVRLTTAALTIDLTRDEARLSIRARDGSPIWEDSLDGGPSWHEDGRGRWKTGMPEKTHYVGFGERTGLLDKRGRRYTCWTTDEWEHQGPSTDPLYLAIPFVLAVDERGRGHGLFLNNTFRSAFDLTAIDETLLHVDVDRGELDLYIMAAEGPAGVLEQFTALTGRMPLPPRWALGYHQARWTYHPDATVRAIAHEFRTRRIPCDALHLDIDHMDGFRVFTWDPDGFPDPRRLCGDLRARGIRLVTIVDAGVKYEPDGTYGVYADGHARNAFVRESRAPDAPEFLGHVWPGQCVFPDHTRAEVRAWWAQWYERPLADGVAGFLNDMNEPAMHDRPYVDLSGKNAEPPPDLPFGSPDEAATHAEVRNVYALLENRATYEGLRAMRPDERPLLLTRAGFAGVQRYAAVWTGDVASYWEHLEMTLPQLLNLGLSGVAFAGADIGGFFGNCDGELLARWMQLGAFYPLMRSNSAKGTARQEPWSWGEPTETHCRRAIELRYRLLPYLYTLFEEAARTGMPVLRALLLHYPSDPAARVRHDEAMLGDALLVAPVLRPGRRARDVYLPRGLWYDLRTGERLGGPCDLLAAAPLDMDPPLYARGGTIVPWAPVRQWTDEAPLDPLTLEIFPDAQGRAEGRLYEDDGQSLACERGVRRVTSYAFVRHATGTATLSARVEGSYTPPPRNVTIVIHGVPGAAPRRDTFPDAPDGWRVEIQDA